MSNPDTSPLAPLPRDENEPVFDEPWQAQALGLALVLVESGKIEAATWSQTLGAELKALDAAGKPDTPQTYYEGVLAAVERLGVALDGVDVPMLETRIKEWRQAYLNTPHGEPVELAAARKQ